MHESLQNLEAISRFARPLFQLSVDHFGLWALVKARSDKWRAQFWKFRRLDLGQDNAEERAQEHVRNGAHQNMCIARAVVVSGPHHDNGDGGNATQTRDSIPSCGLALSEVSRPSLAGLRPHESAPGAAC